MNSASDMNRSFDLGFAGSAMCFGSNDTLYLGTSVGDIECYRLFKEKKKSAREDEEPTAMKPQRVSVLTGMHKARVKAVTAIQSVGKCSKAAARASNSFSEVPHAF